MNRISRREAIRHVTLLLGGTALVGGTALLAADDPDRSRPDRSLFTPLEVDWLDEVAETILPETGTPGARAAEVGAFVALMVTDSYGEEEQAIFRDGMRALEDRCKALHGKGFQSLGPEQRLALLEDLDQEQKRHMDAKKEDDPAHWFRMMKEQTLLGYFTSEIGYTQAMRYAPVPGRFDPCVPMEVGETFWAPHA